MDCCAVDIYDGDTEPVVYHGRTLTTKLTVREICEAIARYAFVASPYPIIISAEVHCGVAQQAQLVQIMREVFGDALVAAPVEGRPRIEALPSPEELKGRVMLKAKNMFVVAEMAAQSAALPPPTTRTSQTLLKSNDAAPRCAPLYPMVSRTSIWAFALTWIRLDRWMERPPHATLARPPIRRSAPPCATAPCHRGCA